MIGVEDIADWRGESVIDPDGEALGRLEDVYVDRDSGTPLLIAVKSGLLGRRSNLIPIDGATVTRDHVRVRHAKGVVDGAPEMPDEGAPDADALSAVSAAYGLRFADRVTLESSAEAAARRAAALQARERADELARDADDKQAARDAARERAEGAHDQATQADRDAEQARAAAEQARQEAERLERHD